MKFETSDNNKALFYIDRWDVFDNLSAFSIVWRGRTWVTVEHAYQAAKFSDESVIEAIAQATSVQETKRIAHLPENSSKVNPDWANIKVSIMRELIRAKCDQHPYVKKKLLESGDMEIIEDSPIDDFWGRGPEWKGKNMLGVLWMELRQEILLEEMKKVSEQDGVCGAAVFIP